MKPLLDYLQETLGDYSFEIENELLEYTDDNITRKYWSTGKGIMYITAKEKPLTKKVKKYIIDYLKKEYNVLGEERSMSMLTIYFTHKNKKGASAS